MTYYKIFTHDYRSPIQRGEPLWDGVTVPYDLPPVTLDESEADCAPGWSFVDDLAAGFRIAGLWSTGRPSRVPVVEPLGRWVKRGEKLRGEGLRILRHTTEDEIVAGIRRLSDPFGEHAEAMTTEVLAWYAALGRPHYDPAAVERGLREALAARGLDWQLQEFPDARAAWAAWDAGDAQGAQGARGARGARAAWESRDAWDAGAAGAARAAGAAWNAGAAWDAWAARAAGAAGNARAALTLQYAARMGWVSYDPAMLTTGLRDAFAHGLALAVPVGERTLGWAMEQRDAC